MLTQNMFFKLSIVSVDLYKHHVAVEQTEEYVSYSFNDLVTSILSATSALFALFGIIFPNTLPLRYIIGRRDDSFI